ncbi:nascent polypeptide-associated complex subunit alpha, muscle-specific form-like [Amphibalanus amphitrite]|uniref:nascent polypeptide-associated complex subunit alpha, muscle-specific form-like n=1 Tax=Amphibalanus amphitrite TaxID=1232801 RepID=UPI001C91D9A3|nr:nascent polypeptide-associated complex subunit alpha, muscle-specific form-like [Amphibalanus amphitrite]
MAAEPAPLSGRPEWQQKLLQKRSVSVRPAAGSAAGTPPHRPLSVPPERRTSGGSGSGGTAPSRRRAGAPPDWSAARGGPAGGSSWSRDAGRAGSVPAPVTEHGGPAGAAPTHGSQHSRRSGQFRADTSDAWRNRELRMGVSVAPSVATGVRRGYPRSYRLAGRPGHEKITMEDSDSSSEELRYGPGIVSRLKDRYISMAMREATRRPSLRRVSSLEHIANATEEAKAAGAGGAVPLDVRGRPAPMAESPPPGEDALPPPDTVKTVKRLFEPSPRRPAVTRTVQLPPSSPLSPPVSQNHDGRRAASEDVPDLAPRRPEKLTSWSQLRQSSVSEGTQTPSPPGTPLVISPVGQPSSPCRPPAALKKSLSRESSTEPASPSSSPIRRQVGIIKPNRKVEARTDEFSRRKNTLNHVRNSVVEKEIAVIGTEYLKRREEEEPGIILKPVPKSELARPEEPAPSPPLKPKARQPEPQPPAPEPSTDLSRRQWRPSPSRQRPAPEIVNRAPAPAKPKWHQAADTTMTFNFTKRQEVPDYVEDDGLIMRRQLPKQIDSGYVILPGFDPGQTCDDDLASTLVCGPPSPCNVVFTNADIIIDGKSSLMKKPKTRKMVVSFNVSGPSTHEYPSEMSLLALETSVSTTDGDGSATTGKLGGLASYTPHKLSTGADFELGVSRLTPAAPTARPAENPEDGDQFLKPADESETVTWSSETSADILF